METFLLVFVGLILPGLVVLWGLLRIVVFFSDRMGSVTLPPGVFAFTVWLHRLFLCLIALAGALTAIPTVLLAIFWTRSWPSGFAGSLPFIIALGALGFYALFALVLNFPGFRLRWHLRAFYPAQLLLLPVLFALAEPRVFGVLAIPSLIFAGLWYWNLADRQRLD